MAQDVKTQSTNYFNDLVAPLISFKPRPEIIIETVPAPQKLAPFALALSADVLDDLAIGRFVLLHDPAGQEGWAGKFRAVTFARADIELEMAKDPLLGNIAWTWLKESLQKYGCDFHAPSGTVTRVASESFGSLSDRDAQSELEIRASWTPTSEENLVAHLQSWLDLLSMCAGLSPIEHNEHTARNTSGTSNSRNNSGATSLKRS